MRRRRAEPRILTPDPLYGNVDVRRLINRVMLRGKKTVAEGLVYKAFDVIEQEFKRPALDLFQDALKNATPLLQVKPRRVGGATYQVPIEVTPQRGRSLAMRWLINGARNRKGIPMKNKLARELMDAARGEGAAVRRKEELHRVAEANRAFVHYRW